MLPMTFDLMYKYISTHYFHQSLSLGSKHVSMMEVDVSAEFESFNSSDLSITQMVSLVKYTLHNHIKFRACQYSESSSAAYLHYQQQGCIIVTI